MARSRLLLRFQAVVITFPLSMKRRPGCTRAFGNCSASLVTAACQIVASRPSSIPSLPTMNAPVQTMRAFSALSADVRTHAIHSASRVTLPVPPSGSTMMSGAGLSAIE